jgi:hypothetical protein
LCGGGQVQGGEHVHHPAVAVVGRLQLAGSACRAPGFPLARHQVQRDELVDAYHPAVGRRGVVQRQDPVHLGDEVRVGGFLPCGRGLPGDLALAQDSTQRLAADLRDHVPVDEVVGGFGQASGG